MKNGVRTAECLVPYSSSIGLIGYGNYFEQNNFGVDESLLFSLALQAFANNNYYQSSEHRWMKYALPQYDCAKFVGWRNSDSLMQVYMNSLKPKIKNQLALDVIPDSLPLFFNSDWLYKGAWAVYMNCDTKSAESLPIISEAAAPKLQYSLMKKGKNLLFNYKWISGEKQNLPLQLLNFLSYKYGVENKSFITIPHAMAGSVLIKKMKEQYFEIDTSQNYFLLQQVSPK